METKNTLRAKQARSTARYLCELAQNFKLFGKQGAESDRQAGILFRRASRLFIFADRITQ